MKFKVFWISFALVFLMVVLSRLNFRPIFLDSPLPGAMPAQSGVWESILPKLTGSPQSFQLQTIGQPRSNRGQLVKKALASSDYESAAAYLVADFDSGQILAEKNSSQRLAVASLTKIMTAVVAQDLTDPGELFAVSHKAAQIEPTKVGVVPGQRWTVEELLAALMLTSANDAAEVITEGIDQKYQAEVFIRAMNEKAKFLGLGDTSFDNPQGFDGPNNFSSARDLAKLTHYALVNYPQLAGIVKKDYQFLPADHNHKQADLYNWNGLLGVYPGVLGVKIGNTGAAGRTTVVLAEREGRKVLVVLLGAPGTLERDLWAAGLLDEGFEALGLPRVGITKGQLDAKYATWKYWGN